MRFSRTWSVWVDLKGNDVICLKNESDDRFWIFFCSSHIQSSICTCTQQTAPYVCVWRHRAVYIWLCHVVDIYYLFRSDTPLFITSTVALIIKVLLICISDEVTMIEKTIWMELNPLFSKNKFCRLLTSTLEVLMMMRNELKRGEKQGSQEQEETKVTELKRIHFYLKQ